MVDLHINAEKKRTLLTNHFMLLSICSAIMYIEICILILIVIHVKTKGWKHGKDHSI